MNIPDSRKKEPRKPLVSIAMATYNGGKYVEQQLQSLLAQDYPNLEIVVCDDGSTDDTVSILRKYEHLDNLVIYVNETNLGYIKNFEKALLLCRGEYIALADQDDLWNPDKISRLVTLAQQGEQLLVYSDAKVIDGDGKVFSNSLRKAQNIHYVSGTHKAFYFHNCVTGCTALIHRHLLDLATPFPEGILVHDWWLAFASARLGKMAHTDEKLTCYRVHEANEIGLNQISFFKMLKIIVLCIFDSRELKRLKETISLWNKRHLDFFKACILFEKSHNLSHETTLNLIVLFEDSRSSCLDKFNFYRKNKEFFSIIRNPNRFLYILSKIIF